MLAAITRLAEQNTRISDPQFSEEFPLVNSTLLIALFREIRHRGLSARIFRRQTYQDTEPSTSRYMFVQQPCKPTHSADKIKITAYWTVNP